MCIFKIGKQNNFMKLLLLALIITMRPVSFSFHTLQLYFYIKTRPHIAINNNFSPISSTTWAVFYLHNFVSISMAYKSKMTIHSSMRSILKRHWPVLLEMRENGVETGGLPLPGSLQVITTIIGTVLKSGGLRVNKGESSTNGSVHFY